MSLRYEDGDIDAAVQFLAAIHGLRASDWAANQPLASEACLSGSGDRTPGRRPAGPAEEFVQELELLDFIDSSVGPVAAEMGSAARAAIAAAGLDFGRELPQEWRSLVPSDFGFHNSYAPKRWITGIRRFRIFRLG